jgi:predicted transcriptional regulator YdeE
MTQPARLETFGPIELMGVVLYGDPANVQFHDAWVHFGMVADEANLSRADKSVYGLQIYPPWFPERFEITYMACMERESGVHVPIRMISKSLPRYRYIVQEVDGGVDGIDRALEYLYREYLPKSGMKRAQPFDFEKYCYGAIEVWIPISE